MVRRALFGALAVLIAGHIAAAAAGVSVPKSLEEWRGWVLQDQDFRLCPLRVSGLGNSPGPGADSASDGDTAAADNESGEKAADGAGSESEAGPAQTRGAGPGIFRCAWPERLSLTLDAHGGTFSQHWQMFADGWVRLPGGQDQWPQEVRVDGHPAAIVAHDGAPQMRLQRGTHEVAGRLTFTIRPERLSIDPRTALVELNLDGRRVTQPERPDGDLWLGKRHSAEQPSRVDVQVYRLLSDEVPARLVTLIRVQVSGEGREELFPRVLPGGFIPMVLDSPLPARLESDGRLRAQVRAGSWEMTLTARGADIARRIARPTPSGGGTTNTVPVDGAGTLWPREEIWSFAGDDRLRVAAAQGAEGIDPVQAGVPTDWRQYPAFRLSPDSVLTVVEHTRGLENTDDNQLRLHRRLWLDFDRGGLTAVDTINGSMRRQWRLEMGAPYQLQSARSGGAPLLVTHNSGGDAGVEVRAPTLSLVTTARTPVASASLPVTGWNSRFDQVLGEINLPPGHRLLAAIGADHAPDAWIESWGLWSVFGVLVVAVFAGWLTDWRVGLIAFVGLVLMYGEGPEYVWLWVNVIGAVALARAAPEGRLRRVAAGYRLVSFVVLGVALLPLLWGQIRVALHPQLEPIEPGMAVLGAVALPRARNVQMELPEEAGVTEPDAASAATDDRQLQEVVVTGQRRDRVANTTLPAGAPPPPIPMAPGQSAKIQNPYGFGALSSVAGGGASERYAAGTLLQTGPGIPRWRYRTYRFSWSGPVEADQKIRFLYIGPALLGLWRVAGVLLLGLLFFALLRTGSGSWGRGGWSGGARRAWPGLGSTDGANRPAEAAPGPGGTAASADLGAVAALSGTRVGRGLPAGAIAGVGILAAGVVWAAGLVAPAHAASAAPATGSRPAGTGSAGNYTTPDPSILRELERRLTRLPECAPTCADITAATITAKADQLEATLTVSALAAVAVPMPGAGDGWHIETIAVDGRPTSSLGRENDGSLLLALEPGVHTVNLAGSLVHAQSIQLVFPAVPHRVAVVADGWDVSGLNDEHRLLSGSLELVRRRTSNSGDTLEAGSEFAPFVQVHRSFDLGLDWTAVTDVTRLAPAKAAMTVEVPLVPGESVLTQNVQTRTQPSGQRIALVALERGQQRINWSSSLARADALELELPADAPRGEIWSFTVSPQWSVAFDGLPAVLPEDLSGPNWTFEFHPRPGEKLRVRVTRPAAVEGATLAVDAVEQTLRVGKRTTDATVKFDYRSTQGGRHAIRIPESARVTQVLLDGRTVPLRPDRGELSIGLLPGSHTVVVEWTAPQPEGLIARPLAVDLHTPASNVETVIDLPADRWVLFVAGAGVGPAILYWSELVAFLVTAWLIGRWPRSPLRTHELLLLGLGLSTLSWAVLGTVAVWLFAMRWRESWTAVDVPAWRFNAVQVALAALTVLAVIQLVFVGIRESLLGSPDMGIAGDQSGGNHFHWFLDQIPSELPRPMVVSVPLWVFRALMFAWALWVVFALLRWIRWAWNAWKSNGLWRGKRLAAPAA